MIPALGAAWGFTAPRGGSPPSWETVADVVGALFMALAVPLLVLVVVWLAAERIASLLAQLVTGFLGEKDAVVSSVRTGREGMVGQVGVARTELAPRGKVFVRGELWNAVAEGDPVPAQQKVEIIDVDGLTVKVRPHHEDESAGPPDAP